MLRVLDIGADLVIIPEKKIFVSLVYQRNPPGQACWEMWEMSVIPSPSLRLCSPHSSHLDQRRPKADPELDLSVVPEYGCGRPPINGKANVRGGVKAGQELQPFCVRGRRAVARKKNLSDRSLVQVDRSWRRAAGGSPFGRPRLYLGSVSMQLQLSSIRPSHTAITGAVFYDDSTPIRHLPPTLFAGQLRVNQK
jgi:hypothetical protein